MPVQRQRFDYVTL